VQSRAGGGKDTTAKALAEPTPCFASVLRRIATLGKRKRELIVNVLCSGGVKHVDFPFGPVGTCANPGFGA
jgi:hypothetical protein